MISILKNVQASKMNFPLMFEVDQIKLNDAQKARLDSLAENIKDKTDLTIFPLTFNEVYQRYTYAASAKLQGLEIVEYMKKPGFEHKGTAINVPSMYRGTSVQVIFKYNTPKIESPFLEKPSQFFTINPLKDTVLVGNEGTKLHLKAGCLLSKKELVLELKEYYTFGDYIKADLPTVSNGKMIQSGGVIYLDVKENNPRQRTVKINPKKGIDVDFTRDNNDTNMQIFIKDPSSSTMNWILPPKVTSTSTSSWQMTEKVYDRATNQYITTVYHSKAEWEEHLRQQKLEKEQQEKERIEEARRVAQEEKDAQESNRLLNVSNLGFINCDRFPTEELFPLIVNTENEKPTNYYLVFTDIRGVMKGNRVANGVQFPSIPKGKNAKLIAMSFDGAISYYYEASIITNKNLNLNIILKEVDKSFINHQLSLVN